MNAFGTSFYVQDLSSDAFGFTDMLAGFANGEAIGCPAERGG
jgi:hypothetical protein